MNYDVYGIGNPLIDLVLDVTDQDLKALDLSKGTMHLVSLEERTKILDHVRGKEISHICGGSCPNTIIALAGLGMTTALGGKVGGDEYGKTYIKQLKEHDVTSSLSIGDGATGTSIILVSEDTERTMNTYLGANREFNRHDIDIEILRKSRFFYFTGYMWDTEEQKDAILKCLEFCHQEGIQVVFDVADPFAVQRNKEEFLPLIENHADIVFANKKEAKILYDGIGLEECAEKLAQICSIAVVKNGAKGSFIRKDNQLISVPVNEIDPVDTTGAGDMYAAGFLYGLCHSLSLYECGILASYLASQIVTQKGAQFSSKKLKEIDKTLRKERWHFDRSIIEE